MLRFTTYVTASPTVVRRISSAAAATAATSGPRAPNRVTISASPTSWPAAHAVEDLGDGAPRFVAVSCGRCATSDESTRAGGWTSAPEYQAVERRPIWTTSAPVPTLAAAWCRSGQTAPGSSRPSDSASDRSRTGKRVAGSSQRSGAAAYSG